MSIYYSYLQPDDPSLNRKGRTLYRKHPRYASTQYTQHDIEQAKKFWLMNPPPKPPMVCEYWILSFGPSELHQDPAYHNIFNETPTNLQENEVHIADSLPNPSSIFLYVIIPRDGGLVFYPFAFSPLLFEKQVDLVVHNSASLDYLIMILPPLAFIKFSESDSEPSLIFTPSTARLTVPLLTHSPSLIDIDLLGDDDYSFVLPSQ